MPKKKSAPVQVSSDQDQERISRPLSSEEVADLNERERAAAAEGSEELPAPPEEPIPVGGGRGFAGAWGLAALQGRLTPLSRQILLWGLIIGAANFLLSLGVNLLLLNLAPDQATATRNQTPIQVSICLNDILWIGLLAFSGMRATARMGMPRHGGMAGAWSSVVAVLLGLLLSFVLSFILPQQASGGQGSLGQDILNTPSAALFNIAIGFGAGYVGGKYSEWKRNKARKQQEAAAVP